MLQDLVGKTVELYLTGFDAGKIKGKVLRVDDAWLEIATKKRIEYVNIRAIKRIFALS